MKKVLLKKNVFVFKYDNSEYNINTNITINIILCCTDEKEKLSDKEIAIKCILFSNKHLKEIIYKLNKRQILCILNAYIKNSGYRYSKIKKYGEFIQFISYYSEERLKDTSEHLSKVSKSFEFKTIEIPNFGSIDNLKNLSKSMNILNEAISDLGKRLQYIVGDFNKDFTILKDQKLENLLDVPDKCLLFMMKLGYPYIDINLFDYETIYDNIDNDNIEEIIDNIIIKNYPYERVDKLLNKWKEYTILDKRIHILEDIVYAYKNEKYNLSIPVIFSQIEGLIAEIQSVKERLNGYTYKKLLNNIVFDKLDNETIKEVTKIYFSEFILKQFTHGGEIPKISRHAILHGADTKYGTKINNLNLIIFFDLIVKTLNDTNKINK